MRSDTLLFFHVLVGMALLGGALTAGISALAAGRTRQDGVAHALRRVSWSSSLVTAAAAVVAMIFGEALASKEDVTATWLDVARALTLISLIAGGVLVAVLARLAVSRPNLGRAVGSLSLVLALVAVAVAFLMAAKPS